MMLEAATGPVIYRTTNKDLIDAGVSVLPSVKFLRVDAPVLENDLDWPDAYHNGIVSNTHRNQLAVKLAESHACGGKRVLLLVTEIAHGTKLQELLTQKGIDAQFVHGGCTSDFRLSAIENFKNGGSHVLVSSTILDEGVDIPTIDVMIMLGGGKSPIKLLQRIGRGLRWKESGQLTVYDFLDFMDVDRYPPKRKNSKPHHGFLTQHSMARYEYLKRQPGFVVEIAKNTEEETDELA
jgi:superfamily II DNA or RNA helicase